jgi:hypothetical protein
MIQLLWAGPVPGGEQGDDLADGWLPGAWLGYRQVSLDLVTVAASVLLRDHVAGLGQVGDDAVGAALGNAQAGRDVATLAPGSWAIEIRLLHLFS